MTVNNFTLNNFGITILCRVVDNYGDIGFAYRLARRIHTVRPNLPLRLVTDNLAAFSLLAPGVDKDKAEQTYRSINLYDWNDTKCAEAFIKNPPRVIVQCFQCGYPDWLEDILFIKKLPKRALVVNVDYLTAEPYAEDFHLLKSLTRTERVQKLNFMTGFTEKTGGLIADDVASYENASFVPSETRGIASEAHDKTNFIPNKTRGDTNATRDFSVFVFTYPCDFSPLVNALTAFEKHCAEMNAAHADKFRLCVYAAAGNAQEQFINSWETRGKPFALVRLPFLPQEDWDALLRKMSFLFVRGEDSLARACLSGLPFVWQAYRQENDYQLIKVDALLERMKPHFSADDFALLSRVWRAFNTTVQNAEENAKQERGQNELLKLLIFELLKKSDALRPMFTSFADSLKKNGDFAAHLIEWLNKCVQLS